MATSSEATRSVFDLHHHGLHPNPHHEDDPSLSASDSSSTTSTIVPGKGKSTSSHSHQCHEYHETSAEGRGSGAVLGQLSVSNIQNLSTHAGIESLAATLETFHIYSPTKENVDKTVKSYGNDKAHARPRLNTSTFEPLFAGGPDPGVDASLLPWPPSVSGVTAHASDQATGAEQDSRIGTQSATRPSYQELLKQHQSGEFEWVLTIPTAGSPNNDRSRSASQHETGQIVFGCSFVPRRASYTGGEGGESDDPRTYTLFASELVDDEEEEEPSFAATTITTEHQPNMSTSTEVIYRSQLSACLDDEPLFHILRDLGSPGGETTPLRFSMQDDPGDSNDDTAEQLIVLSPAHSSSRIEDSVEALDQLEEDLEALGEVTHVRSIVSPESVQSPPRNIADAMASGSQLTARQAKTGGAPKSSFSTVRTRDVERMPSLRKSSSMVFGREGSEERKLSTKTSFVPHKPREVPKPASLLPPKAHPKSTKLPTIPTFELPGESVARRLKEERAQRLSRLSSWTDDKSTTANSSFTSPSKTSYPKSTKPPTIPNFELPGEAISRRKRAEREADLARQQEEERRRRQFKARPLRSSVVPSSYPRETIASRARQNKIQQQQQQSTDSTVADSGLPPATTTTTSKRYSMATMPSPSTMPRASAGAAAAAAAANKSSVTPTLKRQSSTIGRSTLPTRGRVSLAAQAAGASSASQQQLGPGSSSRATSSSAGSAHSGHSKQTTVTAEEVERQKLRGRKIMEEDNRYAEEQARKRLERSAAARTAREEAARQSRELSRRWAEKKSRSSLVAGGTGSWSGSGSEADSRQLSGVGVVVTPPEPTQQTC